MKNLACLFVLVITTACGVLAKPLQKPTVDVTGVAVASVSLRGLDGRLDMAIVNPNGVGLPLRKVDWELRIGDARALRGRADLEETIPANGTAPVATAIHLGTTDAAVVGARLAAGERTYRLEGTLHFDTVLGDLAVDYAHTGELASL